jgi:hypothetical protein
VVSGSVAVIDSSSTRTGQVLSHSPSVTRGFRVAMAYAVLLPERFRGCCTFGATTLSRKVVDSPALPFQQRPDYPNGSTICSNPLRLFNP